MPTPKEQAEQESCRKADAGRLKPTSVPFVPQAEKAAETGEEKKTVVAEAPAC